MPRHERGVRTHSPARYGTDTRSRAIIVVVAAGRAAYACAHLAGAPGRSTPLPVPAGGIALAAEGGLPSSARAGSLRLASAGYAARRRGGSGGRGRGSGGRRRGGVPAAPSLVGTATQPLRMR